MSRDILILLAGLSAGSCFGAIVAGILCASRRASEGPAASQDLGRKPKPTASSFLVPVEPDEVVAARTGATIDFSLGRLTPRWRSPCGRELWPTPYGPGSAHPNSPLNPQFWVRLRAAKAEQEPQLPPELGGDVA